MTVDGEKVPLPPVQEGIRKEERVASNVEKRGTCPGSVLVLVGEVVVRRRVTSVGRRWWGVSRECPSGGGGGGACHKCGEEGHMSRECLTGGGGDNKCRNCRKVRVSAYIRFFN